ncbi:MAG: YcxB family protein [Paracoccaceae bacterium]
MLASNRYRLDDYPWAKAQKILARRGGPRWVFLAVVVISIVCFGWLGLCLLEPDNAMAFGPKTPLVIVGVWIPLFLLLCRVWNNYIFRELNASVIRSGLWQATITDEGLDLSSEGMRQLIAWSHLDEVIDGPEGLLVLSGNACGFPIRAASFANDDAFGVFRSALEARIAAAKGAA